MNTQNKQIGAMLVAAGKITEEQLEEVVRAQSGTNKRIGTLLVERGYINELELTQILSNQLSVAWVSLDHVEFTKEILRLIPGKIAREFMLIPVHSRIGERGERIIYIAMDDPTNINAMSKVAEVTSMHVRPMIAPLSEIRQAIENYYPADGSDEFPF